MARSDQFSWDGIVDGRTTRRIRKKLARLPSSARVELAREAMNAVVADLPTDDEVVTRYYGYFRVGRPSPEPEIALEPYTTTDGRTIEITDDPLNVRQSDYFEIWDESGSVDDFRRQQAVETLTWAVMMADGDDQDVNFPSVEQTINHAVMTLTHDELRRQALVERLRKAVENG